MIIIAIVISIFFIVVIAILCRSYTKDIFELENRLLQFEKRFEDLKHCTFNEYKIMKNSLENEFCFYDEQIEKIVKIINEKEGDNMACKKGRGGRKK